MHKKTVFHLLQVILLVTFSLVSYGQDSITRSRPTKIVKANPAKVNLVVPPQKVVVAPPALSSDKSINGQYQFIISKVYRYQQPMIDAFYKTIQDTLKVQRAGLAAVKSKLAAQTKALSDLKTDADNKEQTLNATTSKVDSINFLGMPVAKATYNTMMWGLVIAFGALAAIVIFLSGSARREAHYRTKLYNELEEEYKGYKTKANDKEKKLSRDLQTVRNKLEEITGKPEY